VLEAVPKMPLAVNVGPLQEHEALWVRALGTHARAHLAGDARLVTVVLDRGLWDGSTLWWLDQPGRRFGVPAKTNMAVTTDARAQATAEEDRTVGRRRHTTRHGQGQAAWTARLETAGVGITGLTTSDQYGTQSRRARRTGAPAKPTLSRRSWCARGMERTMAHGAKRSFGPMPR